MKAVIIGPSDRSVLWRYGKIKQEDYEKFIKEYAKFLAEKFDDVIITPDDGVYTDVADEFSKIKGKKNLAFYPDKDTFYGIEHIKNNFSKYNTQPINGDWYKLGAELTKQSPVVICLGFSPGVLIEGSYIKYHQKYGGFKDPKLKNIHWFIDKRCIKRKLPENFEEEISNIFYYSSLKQLKGLLKKYKELLE